MKTKLLLILVLFTYCISFAQSFTLDTGTPFYGVTLSSIAFADVDGDNDQYVLITGKNTISKPIQCLK